MDIIKHIRENVHPDLQNEIFAGLRKEGVKLDEAHILETAAEADISIDERGNHPMSESTRQGILALEKASYMVEASIPDEVFKHISTGSWKDGDLKSGAHTQKGFQNIKDKGWFDNADVITDKDSKVRSVIFSKHPNENRRNTTHTFFPETWSDKTIRQKIKDILKNGVQEVKSDVFKKEAIVNGVKIRVIYKDSPEPENLLTAYPVI